MGIDTRLWSLREPFDQAELEWRIAEVGKKHDGSVWAKCLTYITAPAIIRRLDIVFGIEGWENSFIAGPNGGTLCGISFLSSNGKWITKYDGADNTDIEAVKGGLSDSFKRAARMLGIGLYLYSLDATFAIIHNERTPDSRYCPKNDKKGTDAFYWSPPPMPVEFMSARDRLLAGAKKLNSPTIIASVEEIDNGGGELFRYRELLNQILADKPPKGGDNA